MARKNRTAKSRKAEQPRSNFRFLLLAFLLPVAAIFILEAGLRVFGFGNDLALFVPAPPGIADRTLMRVNPEVARRYFTEERLVPQPLLDFFEREKPKSGFRIFVLGESVTAGFPYPGNVAFSRIIQGRLADAFPERAIEVINVALTGTNSQTLVDFIDEILDQKPDAILIYAGHNEFYGALGVASSVAAGDSALPLPVTLMLRRLRLMQAFDQLMNRLRPAADSATGSTNAAQSAMAMTLMGRMTAKSDIAQGDATYQKAKAQFEDNLRALLGKTQKADVPVLLSELISNQRDQPPFSGINGNANSPASVAYRDAQTLEKSGKFDEARLAYAKAKDLDEMRFRAPEEFNDVIRALAKQFQQTVVPMQKTFEAASPNGLIGASLMLEHLHPNVDGQFLMSEAFIIAMRDRKLIANDWSAAASRPLAYYRQNWPVGDLDVALGAMRIRQLTDFWPFKPQADAGREWSRHQPQNAIDSLAFNVATKKMRLPVARLELAKSLQREGKSIAALREYRALAADGVWDFQAQLVAAQQLIEAGQTANALPFLQASLKLKETDYAREWLGKIAATNQPDAQKLK